MRRKVVCRTVVRNKRGPGRARDRYRLGFSQMLVSASATVEEGAELQRLYHVAFDGLPQPGEVDDCLTRGTATDQTDARLDLTVHLLGPPWLARILVN